MTTSEEPTQTPNLRGKVRSEIGFEHIIGNSAKLRRALQMVKKVALSTSTVLLLGETGTGKELIARAIHNVSSRCGLPYVKLNCAAIPFDLLESELFGHERGAFTGAIAQKIGRFELADKGTLFLDEVGDLSLALQPKLLRVLQEQEFERLGSGRMHKVDVRLVAATHGDLAAMVAENKFRSDLYYRLNVFPIVLPPLRERKEDIPVLVTHFVEFFSRRMGKQIGEIQPETMAALCSYCWPGNIRELQNLIERAVILANDGLLPNPLYEGKLQSGLGPAALGNGRDPALLTPKTLRDHEREMILRTLDASDWTVGGAKGAAAKLGVNRTTLIAKMTKLGICRSNRPGSGANFSSPSHGWDL